jgi:endonuclease/exonuclease/phosphatase family metal-dependent hydrolase
MLPALSSPAGNPVALFDVGVPLRVVSYNVHSLRDDREALAAVVRSLEPDVLIVQEAPRRFRWRTRCAQLAHSFGMYYAEGGLPSLGNVILTSLRVRVVESWCLRYPLTAGRHMRGAAFTRCIVPGATPFVVAGSHLSTYDGERPRQAGLLLPALGAAAAPIILGIDLNETDSGDSWKLLAADLADVGAAATESLVAAPSLRDGRAESSVAAPSLRDGRSATFPAGAPDRRIDAIFADRRIGVDRFAVVSTPEALRASDHLPLVADLSLP